MKLDKSITYLQQGDEAHVIVTVKNAHHSHYTVSAPNGEVLMQQTVTDARYELKFRVDQVGTYKVKVVATTSEKVATEGDSSKNGLRATKTLEIDVNWNDQQDQQPVVAKPVQDQTTAPTVKIIPDKNAYMQGDTATIRIDTQYAHHFHYDFKTASGTVIYADTIYSPSISLQIPLNEAGDFVMKVVATDSAKTATTGDSSTNGNRTTEECRIHVAAPVTPKPAQQTTPTFTGKFASGSKTMTLGEKYIIPATVSVAGGSGMVGVVKITCDELGGSFVMQDDFSGHMARSVSTDQYDRYRVDTNRWPWNAAGTYHLRLWASDTAGYNNGQVCLATMTLTIQEPVTPKPV